nr:MAG TPA: hypothetical protein [Caudoviricetes sp.]
MGAHSIGRAAGLVRRLRMGRSYRTSGDHVEVRLRRSGARCRWSERTIRC